MLDERLVDEATALRAEKEKLVTRLSEIESELQRQGLTRIEQIRSEITQLLVEAGELSKTTGIHFDRQSFIDQVDDGGTYDPYWDSSQRCW